MPVENGDAGVGTRAEDEETRLGQTDAGDFLEVFQLAVWQVEQCQREGRLVQERFEPVVAADARLLQRLAQLAVLDKLAQAGERQQTVQTRINGGDDRFTVRLPAKPLAIEIDPDYADIYDFYTAHPLIGIFLFADGSVRSISSGKSQAIWEAIGTRAGGEIVSDSDY